MKTLLLSLEGQSLIFHFLPIKSEKETGKPIIFSPKSKEKPGITAFSPKLIRKPSLIMRFSCSTVCFPYKNTFSDGLSYASFAETRSLKEDYFTQSVYYAFLPFSKIQGLIPPQPTYQFSISQRIQRALESQKRRSEPNI